MGGAHLDLTDLSLHPYGCESEISQSFWAECSQIGANSLRAATQRLTGRVPRPAAPIQEEHVKALLAKLDPHAVTAAVTFIVGLLVTNGLITNEDGKTVTGFATAAVALGFLIYGAIKHKTNTQAATAATDLAAHGLPVPPAA